MSKKSLYDQIAEIHGDDIASDVYNRLLNGEDVRKETERLLKSTSDTSSGPDTNK